MLYCLWKKTKGGEHHAVVGGCNCCVVDVLYLNCIRHVGRVPRQVFGHQGNSGLSLSRCHRDSGDVAVLPGGGGLVAEGKLGAASSGERKLRMNPNYGL